MTSPIFMSLIRRYKELLAWRSSLKTSGSLKPRTIEKYKRDAERLRARLKAAPKGLPLRQRLMVAFTTNVSRSSYARELRAAMRHSTIDMVDRNFEKAWAAIEAGDSEKAHSALQDADQGLRWIETIDRMIKEDDWNLSNPQPRKSKSVTIRLLPDGWRERLVEHLRENKNRFWKAVAVLACTGCRPEEVRLQVKITKLDAGAVKFTITSAKAGTGRLRHIYILKGDPFFDLAMTLADANQVVGLEGSEYKLTSQLGDTVRRNAKTLFPKIKENISPYCFRHQMASDLKASGFTAVQVAQALGHTNINTQSVYGRTRHGNKGRRIIVETDIPVHDVLKAHRFATPAAQEARPDLCQDSSDNDPPPASPHPDDDEPSF